MGCNPRLYQCLTGINRPKTARTRYSAKLASQSPERQGGRAKKAKGAGETMYLVEFVNQLSDDVFSIGQTEHLDEAIIIAKEIVNDYLGANQRYSRSANALYSLYVHAGFMPCIFCNDKETLNVHTFDHLQYASVRCVEIYRDIEARSRTDYESAIYEGAPALSAKRAIALSKSDRF
jgi:hypothetical protein